MAKYEQTEGEWFVLGREGLRLACCSCSLVHDVDVRRRNGKIEIRFVRNERATSGLRRKRKREVVIVDE